jgi:hypothetical protein
MEKWFCICNDLANPNNGLNLVPNPLVPERYASFKRAEMKILTFIFSILFFTSCNSDIKKVSEETLKAKSQKLLKAFNEESKITSADSDTLIDLNYDDIKDFVIGYYGQSGTGLKNRIRVYLYDIKKDNYVLNEQLSNLSNPTFYIDQKKITEFYIGNGGGSGSKLEWINGKWIVTKIFEVNENGIKTVWKITYPMKKEIEYLVR